MKYEVRLLQRAQTDLLEIRNFIAGDLADSAVPQIDRLLHRIESLDKMPNRGAQPRDERLRARGYRFLIEKPYLIFYKIEGARVLVFRVLHGRRAYDRIL